MALASRFATMFEVTVSKIIPAGMGWQASSVLADGMGHAADSASFAAITGVGDGLAVAAGHTGYMAIKKAVTSDSSIDMGEQGGLGIWLGSAAVCSGGIWQPAVNVFQASEKMPFVGIAGMTAVACGGAFFTGLRLGRSAFPWMPAPDNSNFAGDANLSMAIGGASSFFVGTDVAYLGGDGNFLRPIVGVEDVDSDLLGVAKAGTSTGLGFMAFQSVQNVVFKEGEAWLDAPPPEEPEAAAEPEPEAAPASA